ncbi:MAG: hypothetical protein FNT15_04060 [Sulfurovum sp.]|jgi:hypothetical protein|nr:MAG: hypothetical protein FNT15_04060 [Sulfurovum sp.]
MKKLIFSLVCLVSVGNFALASSVDDVAIGILEKQDSQAIFGNKEVGAISLSQSEMRDTKGEFWPIVYGAAWGAARVAIWAAPKISSAYRGVASTNNHRILLQNGSHMLQTGGNRAVGGFSQKASHIGWGTSSKANNSAKHIYYNSPWKIR